MHKRFDNAFAALTFAALVAVLLAGSWVLRHSIAQARVELEATPVAEVHIELPEPTAIEPLPTPAPDPYDPSIPLSPKLQAVLRDACDEAGVPVALALGLIEVESRFVEDAVSPEGCYGLMQLNPKYFPDKLSSEDNLRTGIEYLGRLLEQSGGTAAALTAYNAGWDTGRREYASTVLEAAERWSR